ncbi:AAA family ATPase [Janibacter limosus]|uniref:AAA family ATPase n=1 Tax=Janibacter limosus TaxID=53458 RepID=A0AC61U4T9_9MICO|nr:AAA family ATPase [Janibacter limosus]UUZ45004.1 AAA family ATPase [Janibacter limosus]
MAPSDREHGPQDYVILFGIHESILPFRSDTSDLATWVLTDPDDNSIRTPCSQSLKIGGIACTSTVLGEEPRDSSAADVLSVGQSFVPNVLQGSSESRSQVRVGRVQIKNFRGVFDGRVDFKGDALLVAGNSVGKSTICEALDTVLGPERMFRRPVIDEYDFFGANYQLVDDHAPRVEVEVVLVDLGPTAERRFSNHLRKWSEADRDFADQDPSAIDEADQNPRCLPLLFTGRFDPREDDFEGNTFFAHPTPVIDDLSPESAALGEGRRIFGRDDKRHCGYLYLRTNRTGARAMSFQRGSLLDTIVRLEDRATGELWERARTALADLDLREASKLDSVLYEVQQRLRRFMALDDQGVGMHPSDLTRDSIRDTLRVFITASPGHSAVPFNRLSTGSLNLVVFALLTYIAELKGDHSVIFAMEEPEIALPPHSQRRLVDFVTSRMGQAIVTSHSPYVIERFEPESILMLTRTDDGVLSSVPFDVTGLLKPKKVREERRQFAEAILARGVLVVEGSTEAAVVPVAADVLDADPTIGYTHWTWLESASTTRRVTRRCRASPRCSRRSENAVTASTTPPPVPSRKVRLRTRSASTNTSKSSTRASRIYSSQRCPTVPSAFLTVAATLADYPAEAGFLPTDTDPDGVDLLLKSVLLKRKGAYYGYAARLVAEAADASELPESYVNFLLAIDADIATVNAPTPAPGTRSDPAAK